MRIPGMLKVKGGYGPLQINAANVYCQGQNKFIMVARFDGRGSFSDSVQATSMLDLLKLTGKRPYG